MRTWITDAPIDTARLVAAVGSSGDGAVTLFLGIVRGHNDGRTVEGIDYEAYRPMAERVLADIAAEAARRWETDHIAAVHRFGELRVGDASVAIAVASAHRAESFDACRYVIEQIKQRLPIWKRERYSDGSMDWVDARVGAGSA